METNVRITRGIIIAVVLIVITFFAYKALSKEEEKKAPKTSFRSLNVQTETAVNKDEDLLIDLSGKLVAKNRIDIYAEVSGVLNSKKFREGNRYNQGQVIVDIDDSELASNIQAQKSVLLNSISQLLPDLSIDFPNEVEKWKSFAAQIDFNQRLPELPSVGNEKLKTFISSRNVFTNYFNIKSLEVRRSKHKISAPFSGMLSEAAINPGTLVRIGQRLGTFIQPNSYELEASLSLDDLKYVKVGNTVELKSPELNQIWTGRILRINEQLDAATQTVKVYIGVSDKNLKEGQYLSAEIKGTTLTEVIKIPRKLLLENNELYFLEKDSILKREKVQVAYKGAEWVYIKGLNNGVKYLNQAVSSAYDGMIVSEIKSAK